MSELSVCLSSPLATPTILPPTGSVETAQPIRTMAIIVEGGGREEGGGGGWDRHSEEGEKEEEEEGVEEVEEAKEHLEVTDSCLLSKMFPGLVQLVTHLPGLVNLT